MKERVKLTIYQADYITFSTGLAKALGFGSHEIDFSGFLKKRLLDAPEGPKLRKNKQDIQAKKAFKIFNHPRLPDRFVGIGKIVYLGGTDMEDKRDTSFSYYIGLQEGGLPLCSEEEQDMCFLSIDCIKPSHFGKTSLPLIAHFLPDKKRGVYYPHEKCYTRISKSIIPRIRTNINNSKGQAYPFRKEPFYLKLHFRKVQSTRWK